MNQDRHLEQDLREMGRTKIQVPPDLVAKTIERLHTPSPSTARVNSLWRAAGPVGLAAALCLLVLVGFVTALFSLSWFPSAEPAYNIVLSQDARIIAARELLDFELALPAWIPEGFSLEKVIASSEDETFTLVFRGPNTFEPLTVRQSPFLNQHYPVGTVFVDFSSRDGLEAHRTRGCFFQARRSDGTITGRIITFPYKQSFVTISSAISPELSRNPLGLLDNTILQEVARSIVGTEKAELIPPEDKYQLARDWGATIPAYLPQGFRYSGMVLSTSGGADVSVQLNYARDGYGIDYSVRYFDPSPPLELGSEVETVDLETCAGYFYTAGEALILAFQTTSASVEITSQENSLSKDDMLAMAKCIVNPPKSFGINVDDLQPTADFVETFRSLMKDGRVSYVNLGENIELNFAQDKPDTIRLRDYLLSAAGEIRYPSLPTKAVEFAVAPDNALFKLEQNMAAYLSSDSADYNHSNSFRGFHLICTWGGEVREYAFVIRTDAPGLYGP